MKLHRQARECKLVRPAFRLFGAPFTAYLTLGFLIAVPLLIAGWFAARKGIHAAALEREGYTGSFPVVANRNSVRGSGGDRQ